MRRGRPWVAYSSRSTPTSWIATRPNLRRGALRHQTSHDDRGDREPRGDALRLGRGRRPAVTRAGPPTSGTSRKRRPTSRAGAGAASRQGSSSRARWTSCSVSSASAPPSRRPARMRTWRSCWRHDPTCASGPPCAVGCAPRLRGVAAKLRRRGLHAFRRRTLLLSFYGMEKLDPRPPRSVKGAFLQGRRRGGGRRRTRWRLAVPAHPTH